VKEPRRLRDETQSPMERVLLDTASSYRRPPTTRSKTLAALGIGGSAALSAGAARGAWASVASKLGGAKAVAAIVGLGAAIAVPAAYYVLRPARHSPADLALHAVPPVTAAPIVDAPVVAASNVAVPNVAAAIVAVPARTTSAPIKPVMHSGVTRVETQRASPTKVDARASATHVHLSAGLTAEVAALEAARTRLAEGDARAALALLDAYAVAYPAGNLQPEADVLRIEALAKSGRPAAAKNLAQAFMQRYPNSVLTARVRGHLSD
jgi:hypothetical protein